MRIENVVMIIPYSPLGSLKYNYQAAALKPTREVHFHTAHIQILEFIATEHFNKRKCYQEKGCKYLQEGKSQPSNTKTQI